MTLAEISQTLDKHSVLHLATEFHVMTNNPIIVWEAHGGEVRIVSARTDQSHDKVLEILSNVYSISYIEAEQIIQKVKDDRRQTFDCSR